jgi:2-haloacid dehalogenase
VSEAGTAIFDVNETTLELAPVRVVIDDLVPTEGGARAWFARLLQLSMTVTATGGSADFSTLARHALQAVAATGGPERATAIDDGAWERVAAAMASLRGHPDVAPALDRLRSAGWTLVALTNTSRPAVTAQLTGAGLAARFDHILSVDAVGRFKPSAEPYRHACETVGIAPSAAWMVAAHDWDLAGARAVGLATAFVNRPGQSMAPTFPPPDLIVADFAELADRLLT